MAERIKEDIRFYLPSDPYYYQVDNLPLQDLLDNDIKLQDQLDAFLKWILPLPQSIIIM